MLLAVDEATEVLGAPSHLHANFEGTTSTDTTYGVFNDGNDGMVDTGKRCEKRTYSAQSATFLGENNGGITNVNEKFLERKNGTPLRKISHVPSEQAISRG